MDLTDEPWEVLKPIIPVPPRRADGRGRPWRDPRAVLNGILWILWTGAQWKDLPRRYPPYQTCHRRFQHWVCSGICERILQALATDLRELGELDLSECFIDGTFVVAKKGAAQWERPSGARVRSSWLLRTLQVFHSPCTRLLLLHMRSPLSTLPSLKPSRWDDPEDLLGIVPTTVIRSINALRLKALN